MDNPSGPTTTVFLPFWLYKYGGIYIYERSKYVSFFSFFKEKGKKRLRIQIYSM